MSRSVQDSLLFTKKDHFIKSKSFSRLPDLYEMVSLGLFFKNPNRGAILTSLLHPNRSASPQVLHSGQAWPVQFFQNVPYLVRCGYCSLYFSKSADAASQAKIHYR